jgi:hypothetical protein
MHKDSKLKKEVNKRFGDHANVKAIVDEIKSKYSSMSDGELFELIDLYDLYDSFAKSTTNRIMLTNMLSCIKIELDNFMYNAKSEFESVVSTGTMKAYELIKLRLTNKDSIDYIKDMLYIEKIRRECEG